ncbi:hypothetical protein V8C34DRAFT_282113 [Trichoderma compactum]
MYRIDLSLPQPSVTSSLASDFAPRMKQITPLFDTVLESVVPWSFLRSVVKFAIPSTVSIDGALHTSTHRYSS